MEATVSMLKVEPEQELELALAREAKLDKEAKGLGSVLVTELLVRAVGLEALIVAPKLLLADKHN